MPRRSPPLAALSGLATLLSAAAAGAGPEPAPLRLVAGLGVQQVREDRAARAVAPTLSLGLGYVLPAPRWCAVVSLSGTWSGEARRSTVLTQEIGLERMLGWVRAGASLGAAQLAAVDRGRRALFVGATAALSLARPLSAHLELGGALRFTQIAETRVISAGLELRVAVW